MSAPGTASGARPTSPDRRESKFAPRSPLLPRTTPSRPGRRSIELADPISSSPMRRNAKGGIHVNPAELRQCFEFFDLDRKGFVTLQDLKKRLSLFYPNLSLREYKFLMNNKAELKFEDLYALLAQNELSNYDPVAEAFKIYDPHETGYIDLPVFKEILTNLGFTNITEQDIQTLIQSADSDGDGKVSLEDFRRMMPGVTGPSLRPASSSAYSAAAPVPSLPSTPARLGTAGAGAGAGSLRPPPLPATAEEDGEENAAADAGDRSRNRRGSSGSGAG